jgi:hypothetical protein
MSNERITELEDRLLLSITHQAHSIILENKLSKKQLDRLGTLKWQFVCPTEPVKHVTEYTPRTYGDGCIIIPRIWVNVILKEDKNDSWALFTLTYHIVHEMLHCLDPKKSEDAIEAETSRFFRKAMNSFLHRRDELAYKFANGS